VQLTRAEARTLGLATGLAVQLTRADRPVEVG
jgi:hypothetical protein